MANSGITKIEFVDSGFKEILQSEGCRDAITEVTNEVKERANGNNARGGSGFQSEVELWQTYKSTRWVGFVSTTDKRSITAESEDAALTRAIK